MVWRRRTSVSLQVTPNWGGGQSRDRIAFQRPPERRFPGGDLQEGKMDQQGSQEIHQGQMLGPAPWTDSSPATAGTGGQLGVEVLADTNQG